MYLQFLIKEDNKDKLECFCYVQGLNAL